MHTKYLLVICLPNENRHLENTFGYQSDRFYTFAATVYLSSVALPLIIVQQRGRHLPRDAAIYRWRPRRPEGSQRRGAVFYLIGSLTYVRTFET